MSMIRETAKSIPRFSRTGAGETREMESRCADDSSRVGGVSQQPVPLSPSREMHIRRKEEKWSKTSSAFQGQAEGTGGGGVESQEFRYPRKNLISTQFFTPGQKSISDQGLAAAQQFYKFASPWAAQPPIYCDSTTTASGCRFGIRKGEDK